MKTSKVVKVNKNNPKPHIHIRGSVEFHYGGPTEIQTDSEYHFKIKEPKESVFATAVRQLHELFKIEALQSFEVDYKYDKHGQVEYVKIEACPLDDVNEHHHLHVFSCFCDIDNWESEGKPPF